MISPVELFEATGRHTKLLRGKGQQDAEEYLSLHLLENLHHDLQRVGRKEGEREGGKDDEEEKKERGWGSKESLVFKEDTSTNLSLEKRRRKSVEDSFIEDTFTGYFVSSVKCIICGDKTCKYDSFKTLPLAIPEMKKEGGETSIFECLESFERKEEVEGVECDVCGGKVVKETSQRIVEAPKVLVIQLKR